MEDCKLDYLIEHAKKLKINLDTETVKKLLDFKNAVLEQNRTMNLTAITDENEFIIKHILDSLSSIPYIEKKDGTLVDIGCGGGFPSVPIAIALPGLTVKSIDSTAKKVNFVNNSAAKLKIENLSAETARAEDLGKGRYREVFDYATARAVANLHILIEIVTPLLKVGGKFIAYKSNDTETADLSNALTALNCKIDKIVNFRLPNDDERCLIIIEKCKNTPPTYPRQYSTIKNKPL
ncbi:MAG: 16S rRNA (guanine(527)-N(7))-methyltransferase RsmG [Christensenellales bacterium]